MFIISASGRTCKAENQESSKVYQHNGRTRRNGIQAGEHDAHDEADNRNNCGRDDDKPEPGKHPHGGERRKDDQAGDEHGGDQILLHLSFDIVLQAVHILSKGCASIIKEKRRRRKKGENCDDGGRFL